MQWYYSKNGSQLGPISEGELRNKISTGDIYQTDLVWREGMKDWLPVSKVAELAGPIAVSEPGGPPTQAGETNSPYAPPMAGAHGQMVPGVEIPTYLWQSILVTILCCWPIGIPAIVYAAKVDGLKNRGDIQGAMAASKNAKNWTLASLIAGILVGVLVGISVVVGGNSVQ